MSGGPEANRVNEYFCPPDASIPVIEEWNTQCGALISGRRTFDIAGGWKVDHLGTEPIELEQLRVIPSDGVTHFRYRIVR